MKNLIKFLTVVYLMIITSLLGIGSLINTILYYLQSIAIRAMRPTWRFTTCALTDAMVFISFWLMILSINKLVVWILLVNWIIACIINFYVHVVIRKTECNKIINKVEVEFKAIMDKLSEDRCKNAETYPATSDDCNTNYENTEGRC